MTTRDNCPAYLADDIDQLQHQHQVWLENNAHIAEVNALRDGHACSGCGYHVCSCARIKFYTSDPGDGVALGGFDWATALKGAMKKKPAQWRMADGVTIDWVGGIDVGKGYDDDT